VVGDRYTVAGCYQLRIGERGIARPVQPGVRASKDEPGVTCTEQFDLPGTPARERNDVIAVGGVVWYQWHCLYFLSPGRAANSCRAFLCPAAGLDFHASQQLPSLSMEMEEGSHRHFPYDLALTIAGLS
jgi:hypothetical protein